MICQINLNGMIEESAPFSLGISFEPDLVKVARNGELLEVELFQHVPITCKRRDHMCSLQISFISKLVKVEKILKGSLDFISLSSPSVKIQIMGGKVYLR